MSKKETSCSLLFPVKSTSEKLKKQKPVTFPLITYMCALTESWNKMSANKQCSVIWLAEIEVIAREKISSATYQYSLILLDKEG